MSEEYEDDFQLSSSNNLSGKPEAQSIEMKKVQNPIAGAQANFNQSVDLQKLKDKENLNQPQIMKVKPQFSESFDTKIVKDVDSQHDYTKDKTGMFSQKSVRFDDSAEDYSRKPQKKAHVPQSAQPKDRHLQRKEEELIKEMDQMFQPKKIPQTQKRKPQS